VVTTASDTCPAAVSENEKKSTSPPVRLPVTVNEAPGA
jgi:hypothetical protein